MKSAICWFLLFVCLAVPSVQAKPVSCNPPFYFYAVLDSIQTSPDRWTVSTFPWLACTDPDANCGSFACAAGSACTTSTTGLCYNILVANCIVNGVQQDTVIRHVEVVSGSNCTEQ